MMPRASYALHRSQFHRKSWINFLRHRDVGAQISTESFVDIQKSSLKRIVHQTNLEINLKYLNNS